MISEERSRAITYIRVGSMLAIVLCHILQAYSSRWALVFNIGVQAFIALSGYLYGEKLIADWKQWGVGRVKRVYVPLLLFLIAVLPFYLFFHRDVFSWKAYSVYLLNLQGIPFVTGGKMIAGIRHLWFLTAIMIAYFSTPILQRLMQKAPIVFPLLLLCTGFGYWLVPGQWMFLLSWIFLYAICYLYVNIKNTRIYDIGLIVIEMVLVGIVLSNTDIITDYFNPINRAFHDLTGVCVVIFGVKLLSKLKAKIIPKPVKVLDKYSFQIFIVHYFFVIGPFSVAHISPKVTINIILIIAITIVSTIVFVQLNKLANKVLFDRMFKFVESR